MPGQVSSVGRVSSGERSTVSSTPGWTANQGL